MESVIAKREEVLHFLSIEQPIFGYTFGYNSPVLYSCDGYGDGNGSGNGSVSAHEFVNGYGFGSVNGSGFGYGNGYGDRYGSGSGTGSGYGNGYIKCVNGYGDSDGNGSGYGYKDIKVLNGNIVDYIDDVPTIIIQVRGNIASGYIVKDDLTLDFCYIAKVENSFAHGNTLKKAFADAERKEMENMPIEKRIKKFMEVFGSLDSEHKGKEFYDWHHILTGSCKMGRDEFCKAHGINLKKKYTVRYFLDITDESYGRDIIKLIRKAYKEMEE